MPGIPSGGYRCTGSFTLDVLYLDIAECNVCVMDGVFMVFVRIVALLASRCS